MVENLWHHALKFLDQYRTGEHSDHTEQLYQFADQTGILDTHREWLVGRQVDMKIVFYELIRMITGYEREKCKDADMYDLNRSVGKIEGYQELTNKMQRVFNDRFLLDIDKLNKKQDESNLKSDELEKRLDDLDEQNRVLKDNCLTLENRNTELKCEIGILQEKVQSNESDYGEVYLLFQEINAQNDDIEKLDDKIEKMSSHANTLVTNSTNNMERMTNIERKGAKSDQKLENMESADLYLQRSQRMIIERTDLLEKYSKYLEEKVSSLINGKKVEESREDCNETMYNYKQETQESQIQIQVLNNMNIQNQISNVKENFPNEESLNKIQNNQRVDIDRKQEFKTKEMNRNLNSYGNEENMNLSIYHELMQKYRYMLENIENIESIIESQTQKISPNILIETFPEVKSKQLEASTQLQISTSEIPNGNVIQEVSCIKSEVLNIKRHLQLNCHSTSESCKRLEKIENNLFELFGKTGNHFSIYELIDFLVGMNNSLNQMMEGFETSQSQFQLFRNEQEEVLNNLVEQKKVLETHGKSLDQMLHKIYSTNLKEISDFELIKQKTEAMENIIAGMKEKADFSEKVRDNTRSKIVEEDGFIVEIDANTEASKRGSNRKRGGSSLLASWFAKQYGSSCC